MSDLLSELETLRRERHAVILVHNYQVPEVQDVADYLGDSLALSRQAAATDAEVIVFCGVHFMAQTAKLLSPEKTVLMPDIHAGCPMADMITPAEVLRYREQYPGVPVVAYVNTTAEVKAEVDICCTSGNAVEVVKSLPDKRVIFVPDQHLADWVQRQVPEKELIRYPGYCVVHVQIKPETIQALKTAHPAALVIAHPECPSDLLALADHVASTEGMLRFAQASEATEFIIVTERDMTYRLQKENPGKAFYSVETAICVNMKKTTLPKVVACLQNMSPEITIPEDIAVRARRSVQRMIELG